jgi:hypothetical protein
MPPWKPIRRSPEATLGLLFQIFDFSSRSISGPTNPIPLGVRSEGRLVKNGPSFMLGPSFCHDAEIVAQPRYSANTCPR